MQKGILFLTICALSPCSQASVRQYSAGITDSQWTLSEATPIQCRLEHSIPHYGQAVFVSRAGRNINLDFELQMMRLPAESHIASLVAVPPQWRPGKPAVSRSKITLFKQFDGGLSGQPAWTMLSDLESGYYPTFSFNDWYAAGDKTSVALSSVNFAPNYHQFLSCLDTLLPYSFDDISFTVLTYQSNSDQLTKASQKRLQMISEYIKYDPQIELVVVDAYTDSYGGRWNNKVLSERRANAIKSHFTSLGIDESHIEVEGHGERRHIATNENTLGRMTNRRVVISLGKGEI